MNGTDLLGLVVVAVIAIAAKAQLTAGDFPVDRNPSKASVCFSAKAVNSVTTSPEFSTSGDTAPVTESYGFTQKFFKFIFINFCLFEKAA